MMDAPLKTPEDPRPLTREECIVETVLGIIGGATVIARGQTCDVLGWNRLIYRANFGIGTQLPTNADADSMPQTRQGGLRPALHRRVALDLCEAWFVYRRLCQPLLRPSIIDLHLN
jgi:hypothetical protein